MMVRDIIPSLSVMEPLEIRGRYKRYFSGNNSEYGL
jgi:hypothetical protein